MWLCTCKECEISITRAVGKKATRNANTAVVYNVSSHYGCYLILLIYDSFTHAVAHKERYSLLGKYGGEFLLVLINIWRAGVALCYGCKLVEKIAQRWVETYI